MLDPHDARRLACQTRVAWPNCPPVAAAHSQQRLRSAFCMPRKAHHIHTHKIHMYLSYVHTCQGDSSDAGDDAASASLRAPSNHARACVLGAPRPPAFAPPNRSIGHVRGLSMMKKMLMGRKLCFDPCGLIRKRFRRGGCRAHTGGIEEKKKRKKKKERKKEPHPVPHHLGGPVDLLVGVGHP